MNQETLLAGYEKLEKLISKLPGPLQKAILSEMQPVKELFLEQRPPRILLLGSSEVSRVEIVNSLFREQVIQLSAEKLLPVVSGWETFRRIAGGSVLLLDGRDQKSVHWGSGRDFFPPDVVFFACDGTNGGASESAIDQLAQFLVEIEGKFDHRPAVFGILEGVLHPSAGTGKTAAEFSLETALRASPPINRNLAHVVSISRWSRFRADGTPDETGSYPSGLHELLTFLVDELPPQAKLEMARISGVRPAQKKIADTLIKATTAVSAAIGAQPIPLADMPILTGLQSAMVMGIIYISGGELNLRSALKFLGSLGVTIGVGLVFREAARNAAKLLPGFGYAVSGAVAAGGTMAVGRASTAFFIDGVSLSEAKRVFYRKRAFVTQKNAPSTEKLP